MNDDGGPGPIPEPSVTRAEFDRLLAAYGEQQAVLERQQSQLEQQQQMLERLQGDGSHDTTAPAEVDRSGVGATLVDRRSMLRRAGVAAGAVVGGVAGAAMSSSPAAAADGGNLILGSTNTASTMTALVSSDPDLAFVVRSGAPAALPPGTIVGIATASQRAAIAGRAEGSAAFAVRGEAFGTGGAGGYFGAGSSGSQLRLGEAGADPPSRPGQYYAGCVVLDAARDLWLCVNAGTPGEWRRLGGLNTAGSLTVLPAPKRVFDSRAGQVPLNVAKGAFVNQTKSVDAKNNSSGVPAGATAVLVNFAVTNTNSGGFGALWASGVADPGTANINWGSAGMTISNSVVTAVGSNALFNCKIAGSADVIIDVIGYYR